VGERGLAIFLLEKVQALLSRPSMENINSHLAVDAYGSSLSDQPN
jgi:hypothetical protein